jgi:hypothetical protein
MKTKKMRKADLESFSKIIARVEDWQNRQTVRDVLKDQAELNQIKSGLIRFLTKIENL